MEPAARPPDLASPRFADLAVDGTRPEGGGTLTYRVPPRLRSALGPGSVVWVPLRSRWALAVVLRLHDEDPPFEARDIQAAVEPSLALSPERLEVGRWLARETACGLFAALSPFLPPGLAHSAEEWVGLASPQPADLSPTPTQARVLHHLEQQGETEIGALRRALGSSLSSVLGALDAAGAIVRTVRSAAPPEPRRGAACVRLLPLPDGLSLDRAPKQRAVVDYLAQRARLGADGANVAIPVQEVLARSGADRAAVTALVRKGVLEESTLPAGVAVGESGGDRAIPALTPAQADAWHAVEAALATRDSTPFLLHGVTGSGKTEVYLRAVAWCLRHGRGAIVLAPEIALASQVVRRFTARFPGQVAVLHSALGERERREAWQAVADGQCRVVVGPRSALFAPMENIGLIVLDEEHESTYKQDAEPRYHARSLAEELARETGAVIVLGSATPSVETAWRAEQGEIRLLVLPDRVGPAVPGADGTRSAGSLELPPVEVVDMRLELHRGNPSLFSEPLRETLERTLARNEQAILLLNRRGLATVVLCKGCGRRLTCPWCDIPLVYHGDRGYLLCHRCDHREMPPNHCSACGSGLNYFGAGTQRVEAEIRRIFPDARVLRWDQDVTRRKGGHETLLRQVERHEADIVVGTQMIAKGLDLPLVTAIGVINADTTLHLPDFRSGERTFQLLTQVAGRAGRRGPGSRVVVQSYTPEHYAIRAAASHDYDAFFAEEIDFRRSHHYPPFTRLVRYVIRDADEARASAAAEDLALRVARHARGRGVPFDLLGPTPAFATKVRGQFQWQFILRSDDLEALLDGLPSPPGWTVDVDPQSLL